MNEMNISVNSRKSGQFIVYLVTHCFESELVRYAAVTQAEKFVFPYSLV